MTGQDMQAPKCSGCHFGCSIDNYQCARGKKFLEQWQAGEEIPERRMPGPGGPGGKGGRKPPKGMPAPSADERLAHMLTICSMFLQRNSESSPALSIATAAMRQDGFASKRITGERARLKGAEFDAALQEAADQGLVTVEDDDRVGAFVHVTDAGRTRANEHMEQAKAANAELLSCYSSDEKEQLQGLLDKLLAANRERMAPPRSRQGA